MIIVVVVVPTVDIAVHEAAMLRLHLHLKSPLVRSGILSLLRLVPHAEDEDVVDPGGDAVALEADRLLLHLHPRNLLVRSVT